MGEHATVYDFTTRRRITSTPEHPVVEGQVAESTTPNLPVPRPVHLPAQRSTPGRSIKLRAAGAVAAEVWNRHGKRTAYNVLKFLVVDAPFATVRGAALFIRSWWYWVHQTELRREYRMDGRMSAKGDKLRDECKDNVEKSAIGAVIAAVVLLAVWHWTGPDQHHLLIGLALLVLFVRGYQWRRPRKPVMLKPNVAWGGSLDGLRRALIDAKMMKDDQDLRTVKHPRKVGGGIEGVAQLPPGLSVAKVIKSKAAVSSGLACDSDFLAFWKVGSDDKLGFWVPDGDPFSNNVRRLALLDVDRWNAWRPAPFGFTARDQVVDLLLMYSNMLIGAKPGAGKSWAARPVVAPYILDPTVPIYVANGKPDGAWLPLKDFATRYICGRSDEMALQVDDMLSEVQAEMDRRFADHLGRSSKLTEAMGVPPMLVVVDELQNYTTNGLPADDLRGKKATLGDWIDFRLTDIAKNGRAAGVILVLVTQRPSDESLSTELRAQLGTRFALRCMDYQTSNMILGNVSKLGHDASLLQAQHRGVGILALDMEEGTVDEAIGDYPKVRTFMVDDDDWLALCEKGLALRLESGTVPTLPDVYEDGRDIEPTPPPPAEVPDLLESVFDYTVDLDGDERVPTLEIQERFDPELSVKKIGALFRSWGAPSGRDRGGLPSGPKVGDIRSAVERIRSGGPVEIVSTMS